MGNLKGIKHQEAARESGARGLLFVKVIQEIWQLKVPRG